MSRVVHFDIMAADPDRAIEFYSTVFGWEIEPFDGEAMEYWMIRTGDDADHGIDGGLTRRQSDAPTDGPANAFVCAVDVDDVDAAVDAVEAAGGVVTTDVMDVDGAGRLAYCLDTEGNQFSLWENGPGTAGP